MCLFKRFAARLPHSVQFEMERYLRAWQIRTGDFRSDEPEFRRLSEFVGPGDWVVDVGANIGHYTLELARLVGPEGRVLALEPVPEPFAHLSCLVAQRRLKNVTLMNVAASDTAGLAEMAIPLSPDGLPSYYDARLGSGGERWVYTMKLDDLEIPEPLTLVKIDAEGHELAVLRGMVTILREQRPTLIVEDTVPEVEEFLSDLGYVGEKLPDSPNRLFVWRGDNP